MEYKKSTKGVRIEFNIGDEEDCIFCEEFGGIDEFFYFVAENMEHILKALETEDVELILKSPSGDIIAKIKNDNFEVLIKNREGN